MQEIATRVGKNTEQMVEEGRSSARRGELLEHDDVVERIDKLLRSSAADGDAREVDAFNQMIRKLRSHSRAASRLFSTPKEETAYRFLRTNAALCTVPRNRLVVPIWGVQMLMSRGLEVPQKKAALIKREVIPASNRAS